MTTSHIAPKWLYHGTSKKNLWKIIREGLKPRSLTGNSNWKHIVESHSEMVYLTNGYATYFGFDATKGRGTEMGLVRIDPQSLDQTRLFPDEDYVALHCAGVPAELVTMEQRIDWCRTHLQEYQHLWPESINHNGTCCYRGTIRTSAIEKAVIVDMVDKCSGVFGSMLFGFAVTGSINASEYAKKRNRLALIDSYLFKEPPDLDAWAKEFLSPNQYDSEPHRIEFKAVLQEWQRNHQPAIKELKIKYREVRR